ncbi:uncharacterized protein LOC123975631 isoform X3 [Micropterus dolomieu]|uniref:uncharacterized protein LOC123975631 isoform X3 n=1 Tax=Micropterus dolomieu TaxID=147949 RepID=UPI001E8D287D|nr:uncharacterized protein LOC123975631 isoform X3 [Micropterus dolomieu]
MASLPASVVQLAQQLIKSPSLKEMAQNLAVNVVVQSGAPNRYELLAWVNESLQTGFTKVEQICTGAAFCQLMDWLFPGSLDLCRVRFQSNKTVDFIHNYSLLQAAFRKVRVVHDIPIEELMKRNSLVALTFLQWFKLFFDQNNKGREYHALEARGGQSMVPDSDSSQTSHQKLEIILKVDGQAVEEPRNEKPRANLNRKAEVVVFISDDEDDVVDVTMEQKPEKMETQVKEECPQPQKTMKVEQAEAAVDKGNQGSGSYSSDTLLHFIRRYWSVSADSSTDPSVPTILSPIHPRDIILACYDTPYCLYLYTGVELGEGQSTSVILIGYFDQSAGVNVVRLLHTLEMNSDTDAQSLIQTLKKCGLPLPNLAVFYCNSPNVEANQAFVAQLKAFNPGLISLCGLSGIAGRASQAALSASFHSVVDLVRDIHHHYSTFSSVNDSLKELFADAEPYNPSCSISAQCLFIINTVQKMVSSWRDVVDYFKSLRQAEDTDRIRTQLMSHKVKLQFLFLSHTLEPLRALQELQQDGKAEVAVELQLTSMLVHSYAASLLQPSVAECFLRNRELHVLHNEMKLLPTSEVNVGSRAREFLWATAVVDLGDHERREFLKDAASFYKAALQSIVESIPKQLGDVALRNIGKVLKHPENINDNKLSRLVLLELGDQLGLCEAGTPEQRQLAYDYASVVKTAKEEQTSGTGHCWAKMLRGIRPYSTLHRLLLTVLALPSSLCRTQVFAKAFNTPSILHERKETSIASSQPGRWTGRPRICRRKPVKARNGYKKKEEEAGENSSEESDGYVAKTRLNIPSQHYSSTEDSANTRLNIPSQHYSSTEDSDYTDNSSDVVDLTEDFKVRRHNRVIEAESDSPPQAETVVIVSDDDDVMVSTSTPSNSTELLDAAGELVWGQVEGFTPWPAVIVPCRGEVELPGKRMVEWYGQRMSSQVSLEELKPFGAFAQHFSANSFAILVTYREAIFLSLQEAALRCKKQFSPRLEDRDELLKQMLDWAFGGFEPTGPGGFIQGATTNGVTKTTNNRPKVMKKLFPQAKSSPHSFGSPHSMSSKSSIISAELKEVAISLNRLSCDSLEKSSHRGGGRKTTWEDRFDIAGKGSKGVIKEKGSRGGWTAERWKQGKGGWEGEKDDWGVGKGKGGWKGGKSLKKKIDGFDDDMSPDFVPHKKRTYTKVYNKVNQATSVYTQPDQKLREKTIRKIMDMKLDIEGFCLCCGTDKVEVSHPLFKGSLCLDCKNNLTETLYRYDEDGYQSYCTICCYGLEVILCGNNSCCRSYCADCMNILVSPGTFDSLKLLDPWICCLCQPHRPHGALIPRKDWSIRVQELFANNSAMEFLISLILPCWHFTDLLQRNTAPLAIRSPIGDLK